MLYKMKETLKYTLYITLGFATLITLEIAYNYYKNASLNGHPSQTETTEDSNKEEEKKQ
jgi:hypothetical protein